MKQAGKRLAVALGTLLVAGCVIEVGFRLLEPAFGVDRERLAKYRSYVCDGEPMMVFEPRAHTVFSRPRETWFTNSLGFNDEEWSLAKTPGVPRIVCLGGSTTEGGNDGGREGSYPWLLEKQLEERTGLSFEVLNCGLSGWTSAETLVAWFLTVKDYAPDLVIVHHAVNDVMPRDMPGFRPDYTHWRHAWDPPRRSFPERFLTRWSDLVAWLRLPGETPDLLEFTAYAPGGERPFTALGHLPAATAEPFRRNVRSIGEDAVSIGADVMLLTMPLRPRGDDPLHHEVFRHGVDQHNRILRELAEERGWLLGDAAALFETDPELARTVFLDLAHLDPGGNRAKARAAADVLIRDWLPKLAEELKEGPPRD